MSLCRTGGLLALLLLAAPSRADEPTLRWKFDTKTPFYVRMKEHKKDDHRKYGQQVVTEYDLDLIYRVKPLEVKPDGGAVVEVYFQSIHHQPVGGQEVVGFRVIEGKAVRVTLGADMRVNGIDGIVPLVRAATSGQEATPVGAAAEKQFRSLFEYWFVDVFVSLPSGSGKPGQQWTQTREEDLDWSGHWCRKTTFTDKGPVKIEGRELRKIDRATAITLTGPAKAPVGSPYEDPTGEIKGGSVTGTILFDPAAGRPVRIERKGHLHTLCTMKYQGRLNEDEAKQDDTWTVDILDKDPLQGEGAKVVPQLKPAEALAREDRSLPRQFTNSIGMKLNLIPHGKFLMGSPRTEEGRNFDEEQHEVEITRPFYMGAYEVTVGQFRQFVADTGYKTAAEAGFMGGQGYNAKTNAFDQGKTYTWKNPGFAQTDDHPVGNVSWDDARAFCEWLSRKEGRVYCLPTEAEWEYACRAGTTAARSSGASAETLVEVGNVGDASVKRKFPTWQTIKGDDGFLFTAPVGHFKPNGFGLYDTYGNVLEWCQDWAGSFDLKGKKDPRGSATGFKRIARGGCYADYPDDIRSARRTAFAPMACISGVGFRAVVIVPVKTP